MARAYDIIHEDAALVIVDKSSGLLSIPDRYLVDKPNLQSMLQREYGEIWTVHRLDRDTSGLLVFAKTEEAHRHLSQQFEQRTAQKTYLALAQGQLDAEEGSIDYPIAPNKQRVGRMMVSNKGREALTTWKVTKRFQHFTLVEVALHTGRTHQIRVHFMAIGHPLAADPLYGKGDPVLLSQIKGRKRYRLGKDQQERPILSRTGLHAYRLGFVHPTTEAKVQFQTEPPKDMRALLNQLSKWDRVD